MSLLQLNREAETSGECLPGAEPGDIAGIAYLDFEVEANSGEHLPGLSMEDIARLADLDGDQSKPDPLAGLTLSERQAICLAVEDKENREIGEQMGCSPGVVGNYLSNAYGKLGITGRNDLAALLPAEDSAKDVDISVLTEIKRDIFYLVGKGLTPKQISLQLANNSPPRTISPHRVRIHNQRTRELLGLAGAVELRQVARDHVMNEKGDQVIDASEPETPVDADMPTAWAA